MATWKIILISYYVLFVNHIQPNMLYLDWSVGIHRDYVEPHDIVGSKMKSLRPS